jgi:hypothetical protein
MVFTNRRLFISSSFISTVFVSFHASPKGIKFIYSPAAGDRRFLFRVTLCAFIEGQGGACVRGCGAADEFIAGV